MLNVRLSATDPGDYPLASRGCCTSERLGAALRRGRISAHEIGTSQQSKRESNNCPGFDGAGPGVTLRSSNLEETIRQLGALMQTQTEIRAAAIARGRVIKRVNAWTAALCGGVPAGAIGTFLPTSFGGWLVGFVVGLLWANLFEYAYHRFLLHLPGTFFGKRHLGHHASVGTLTEAEHVNLGSSPIWVVALFAANGLPAVIADLLFRLGIAPGIFVGFSVYFITVEEIHWRIHLEEWLPPVLGVARAHHLLHHARPDARFNIFLPLWDTLLGPVGN